MEKIQIQLSRVQNSLVAPKSQFNKFGGYSYRSCEDILNAAKPLLVENGLTLTISDEVVCIGERYYVKATAEIVNIEFERVSVSAYAREDQSLKGMNESQITGSTSSYARKYALNGLFCIDDTKDSDATNERDKGRPEAPKDKPVVDKPINKPKVDKPAPVVLQPGDQDLICSSCGTEITKKVFDYCIDKNIEPKCYVCQKK